MVFSTVVRRGRFEKTFVNDGLQLNVEGDGHPHRLHEYIQAWKIHLWEHGFLGFLRERMHIQIPRHLRTTSMKTWQLSVLSFGISILIFILNHFILWSNYTMVLIAFAYSLGIL
jgi:hypothetical protein